MRASRQLALVVVALDLQQVGVVALLARVRVRARVRVGVRV